MADQRRILIGLLFLAATLRSLPAAAPPTHTVRDVHGDPLPRGAMARLGTVRFRHDLHKLFFSADGRTLISCGEAAVRLWDADTGRLQREVRPGGAFQSVRLLADGKTLVTAEVLREGLDSHWRVERWQRGTGVSRGRVDFPVFRRNGLIDWCVPSDDGKWLFTASIDERVKPALWEAATARRLREFDGHSHVVFTPDGRHLVLSPPKGGIHLQETATGKHVRELAANHPRTKAPVVNYYSPTVSPDGRYLAANGCKGLHVWNLRTGQRLAYLAAVQGSTCFSPDGKWLVCVANCGIHLLEARSLKVVRIFDSQDEHIGGFGIAFSPDGNRLALAGEGSITLWDVHTGKPLPRPAGHLAGVDSLAFSHDGRKLASGGQDGTAYVWDVATRRALHTFAGHHRSAAGLAFSPDDRVLATGDGYASNTHGEGLTQVRLFDLAAGRLVRRFDSHLNGTHTLVFSPDGKRLATGGWDARIRVWETSSGRRLGQVRHLPFTRPVSWKEGETLLIEDEEGHAGKIDTKSFSLTPDKRVDALPKQNRVESPDRSVRASSSDRHEIELFDRVTGDKFATLPGHTSYVTVMAFSPDGRVLAARYDTTVLLWDVERLRWEFVLSRLLEGRGQIHHLAAFPRQGIAALTARLRQESLGEQRARKWIQDLDADGFAVREKASEELAKFGLQAAFALRQAVALTASAEVRLRCQRLLGKLARKDLDKMFAPASVRKTVALFVKLGTPEARRALEELEKLDRETLVGREARLGLEQMRNHGSR